MDIQKVNQAKENIAALRQYSLKEGEVISAAASKAQVDTLCAILDGLNERIAILEQETTPGNAFIPFSPTVVATPIR